MNPDLLALAAIALWGTLATLGVALGHVPPFLLTGLGLLVGSLIALPLSRGQWSAWRVPPVTLGLGIYGLFGFHFLLFLALRTAPPVEANLVNYLWPLGMVVLAPWLLPGVRASARLAVAGVVGFIGAAIAILGRANGDAGALVPGAGFQVGYLYALASAFVWASYSLWTRRVPAFPTAAVGSFAGVSGLLALGCHALLEPAVRLSATDAGLIALLGLGPLGGAFFLWDAALKRGDPRRIGLLAFLTPLASTAMLIVVRGEPVRPTIVLAAVLIIGAAFWGGRMPRDAATARPPGA